MSFSEKRIYIFLIFFISTKRLHYSISENTPKTQIVCAFAPNIEFFIVLRFIQGFVASAGLVISRAIVRDMYSGTEMTKFVSLLTIISNVTPLPLAGSSVISYTSLDWSVCFFRTIGSCSNKLGNMGC